MRIAYVITRADEIGGAQVHVRDIATALHQRGHEVTVIAGRCGAICRGAPGAIIRALRAAEFPGCRHILLATDWQLAVGSPYDRDRRTSLAQYPEQKRGFDAMQ